MLSIAQENPALEDALTLLRRSEAYSASLYPPESNHQPDLAALSADGVRFFVARLDGKTAGCGALMRRSAGQGELKRMFVDPAARGHGSGRALLDAIEAAARAGGIGPLQLETGIHNHAAIRLYRRCGYRERGPFGGYAADPLSVFMEKTLGPT
jgi:putative acetyltransferase